MILVSRVVDREREKRARVISARPRANHFQITATFYCRSNYSKNLPFLIECTRIRWLGLQTASRSKSLEARTLLQLKSHLGHVLACRCQILRLAKNGATQEKPCIYYAALSIVDIFVTCQNHTWTNEYSWRIELCVKCFTVLWKY